ncbi:methyltransferase domain-containing protein [Gordonia sp. i37]|uniref:class I SAM-dependent methyltransferase n=1 Tax=Gordonia sp. i37 TaxID=1961707 RepID=UPI0009AC3C5D|nr:methyltransferase domain-containing protein [Gordonia sp. i37]OPX15247.1 hypothetical protein B1964_11135 [Gordonia sp. i37]
MTIDEQGTPATRFWEPLYAAAPDPSERRPNVVFEAAVAELQLRPGRAWDMGCGHGGDALWLATLGWEVWATDASTTAVRRVDSAADVAGLTASVHAEQYDLTRSMPAGPFDLVYANYFHSPVEFDQGTVLAQAASRVVTDGHLIVIDHASSAPWSWEQRDPESFPTPQQLRDAIGLSDSWSSLRCERSERVATGPDGQTTATVADNVIVLRRSRLHSSRAEVNEICPASQ